MEKHDSCRIPKPCSPLSRWRERAGVRVGSKPTQGLEKHIIVSETNHTAVPGLQEWGAIGVMHCRRLRTIRFSGRNSKFRRAKSWISVFADGPPSP